MIMGYVPPKPPNAARLIPSDRDCEYCGTYNDLGIRSRCSGCGAPFRRRPETRGGDFVRPSDVGTWPVRPIMPRNRIVRE